MTEKYLDFSFEKTNSAYMLFYERRLPEHLQRRHSELLVTPTPSPTIEEKSEPEDATKMETSTESKADVDVEGDGDEKGVEKEKEPVKDNRQPTDIAGKEVAESKPVEMEVERKEDLAPSTQGPEKCEAESRLVESTKEKEKKEVEPQTANCDNHKPRINSQNRATSNDSQPSTSKAAQKLLLFRPLLNKELEDWIWQDNRQFLQDRNIFEHTYFK